jgi:hypothetical protein
MNAPAPSQTPQVSTRPLGQQRPCASRAPDSQHACCTGSPLPVARALTGTGTSTPRQHKPPRDVALRYQAEPGGHTVLGAMWQYCPVKPSLHSQGAAMQGCEKGGGGGGVGRGDKGPTNKQST